MKISICWLLTTGHAAVFIFCFMIESMQKNQALTNIGPGLALPLDLLYTVALSLFRFRADFSSSLALVLQIIAVLVEEIKIMLFKFLVLFL